MRAMLLATKTRKKQKTGVTAKAKSRLSQFNLAYNTFVKVNSLFELDTATVRL